MSGVGKTTAAKAVARRHDLWLYSIDARTYAHAEAMDSPSLRMTMNELWVERTPLQMADDFEAEARDRFALVLADLAVIPVDGAPVLAEGPQLQPELVPEPVLFLAAASELQRELLASRGSFTYSSTSDPDRAFASRIRRDELLTERLQARTDVVEVSNVSETEQLIERFVRAHAHEWLAREDHGDIAARRRDENDRTADQWRRYAAVEPRARDLTFDFACECGRPGCTDVVTFTLDEALSSRR